MAPHEQSSATDEAVIDLTGSSPLRSSGYRAEGDVVGVEAAMAAGMFPLLVNPYDWPVATALAEATTTTFHSASTARIAVMDELIDINENVAILRPPSLYVGVRVSHNANDRDLLTALTDSLADANLARSSVAALITVSDQADHSAIRSLGIAVQVVEEEPTLQARSDEDQRTLLEGQVLRQAGRGSSVIYRERGFGTITLCIARRRPTPRRIV